MRLIGGGVGHMPRLLIQVTLIQQEQQVPLSDAMSVTESQRLNVIQITKRHLGLETRALAAVSAGLCTPPPPHSTSSFRPPRWGTHQPAIISRTGRIKTNIFSLKQTWMNAGMISGKRERLLTDRLDAVVAAAFLYRAAVTSLEALIGLFWHKDSCSRMKGNYRYGHRYNYYGQDKYVTGWNAKG